MLSFLSLSVALCATLSSAVPVRRAANPYAPVSTICPSTQLVRQANGISSEEAAYISQRYSTASQALESWLSSIDSGFGFGPVLHNKRQWTNWETQQAKAPVIALTSSGGGYRAQLTGAGVIKAFDDREENRTAVSGLYQALTYEAGLSGGSWLLSSIIGNNWPTISYLQNTLWETALQYSIIVPEILVSQPARPIYNQVEADIQAKAAAGYETSVIDSWGRLLSTQLLLGPDGGVQDTISNVASESNFTSYKAPYPIITALGSDLNINGVCIPQVNATQYEFHPYEFGSWDNGVDAFVVSEYLGTQFNAGNPVGQCVTHYDQLGYVLGTSSNVFGAICSAIPANMSAEDSSLSLVENLAYLASPGAPGLPEAGIFGLYPNPFQNFSSSPHVAAQKTLELVDGGVGVGFQGNPIWPFLHRDIDVIVVNDNSADTTGNFPNGSEILNTYNAAVAAGLTTMPVIPSVATFVSEGLNQKPTFFGCNTTDTLTIIYIPNYNYTYPSGTPTDKIQYYKNETIGMIANGVEIGNYGGKADWPLCLACGVMKKSNGPLPSGCDACYSEYCYN